MEKLIKANSFGIDFLDLFFTFPCDIHHCYIRNFYESDSFKVLLHACEPSPLKWTKDEVIKNHSKFDLILTSDKALLNLPNTKFFIFGDCWVKDYNPKLKNNSISYLYSRGIDQNWDGYNLRKEIWRARDKLKLLNNLELWYSSRRPPNEDIKKDDKMYLAPDKSLLFDSMYSICIENIREYDYFTEKIIDSFATYTVPVYFGCPNIADYFDMDGIVIVNSLQEIIDVLPKLNLEFFQNKLKSIMKNKLLSEKFKYGVNNIRDEINGAYLVRKF